jgi:hypothetical protein
MEFSIGGGPVAGPCTRAGWLAGAIGSLHGDTVGLVHQWPMR